jgi:hypothetical protein
MRGYVDLQILPAAISELDDPEEDTAQLLAS